MPNSPVLNNHSPSVFHAWWLAIRPKTLPASIAGVITGIGVALHLNSFRFLPALAALLVGLLLQISSNLANDVFDYEKGTDTPERIGPTRVTQAGILTPRQVKTGLVITILMAGCLGIYLALEAGWVVIWIGVAAILGAVLYTAGPFPLGYHGLGDLFVFLFFGLASVVGTTYVQMVQAPMVAWAMAVPIGLLVVNLLVVNNLRDIVTDQKAGKFTMAIWMGERNTRIEYLSLLSISYLLIPVYIATGLLPVWSILTWLSMPMGVKAASVVWKSTGPRLNPALAQTSQLAMVFGFLFLFGILLSKIW